MKTYFRSVTSVLGIVVFSSQLYKVIVNLKINGDPDKNLGPSSTKIKYRTF